MSPAGLGGAARSPQGPLGASLGRVGAAGRGWCPARRPCGPSPGVRPAKRAGRRCGSGSGSLTGGGGASSVQTARHGAVSAGGCRSLPGAASGRGVIEGGASRSPAGTGGGVGCWLRGAAPLATGVQPGARAVAGGAAWARCWGREPPRLSPRRAGGDRDGRAETCRCEIIPPVCPGGSPGTCLGLHSAVCLRFTALRPLATAQGLAPLLPPGARRSFSCPCLNGKGNAIPRRKRFSCTPLLGCFSFCVHHLSHWLSSCWSLGVDCFFSSSSSVFWSLTLYDESPWVTGCQKVPSSLS